MAKELENIYTELRKIRTYLIKIGPKRRLESKVCSIKLEESTNLFYSFKKTCKVIEDSIKGLKNEELILINEYRYKIEELFVEIKELCEKESSYNSSDFESLSEDEEKIVKMAKFDLKIALNLLPVMTNDELSVKQLIDGIDYYSSILDSQSQEQLITFVLKSRLSQAAKLKLASNYDSVKELLHDMRVQLLPIKSATAIQSKLHSFCQKQMTIDEYGKAITEMFVDLTIAQSEGKPSNYQVLKPLNEKQAIKRFADGLRNRRLSTIIAARNFESLKDAVQAAVDEETSMPSTSSGEIMAFNQNSRYNYRRATNNHFRGQRTFRGRSNQGYTRGGDHNETNQDAGRGRAARGSWRNSRRFNRGRSNFHNNRNKWTRNSETLQVMTEDKDKNEMTPKNEESKNQFFRA